MFPCQKTKRAVTRSASRTNKRIRPFLESLEDRYVPAAIVVTSTADSVAVDGVITLREAILSFDAGGPINADVPASSNFGINDLLNFKIPGSGVHVIQPKSALPAITNTLEIDGYSQPSTSPNSFATGLINNAVITIVLDGSNVGSTISGLRVQGNGCVIQGLNVRKFGDFGIDVSGNQDKLMGNFIGTDVTGKIAMGISEAGVHVSGMDCFVGALDLPNENIISGNGNGITVDGNDDDIFNNLIGVDSSGASSLGNGSVGVQLNGTNDHLGSQGGGHANLIGASGNFGVAIGGNDCTIQGNFIGVTPGGTPVGNGTAGIVLQGHASNNLIGGRASLSGNFVAFNGNNPLPLLAPSGIGTASTCTGTGNTIVGNTTYSNQGLDIDLGLNGVTLNDTSDSDTGANGLQNYPMLKVSNFDKNSTAIAGTLTSRPNSTFIVDFYATVPPAYLGWETVFTDASGSAPIFYVADQSIGSGFLVATATDITGSTSELSSQLAPAGTTQATNGGYVNHVFVDLLHRAADAGALAYFSSQLMNGVSRGQVTAAVVGTSEYETIVVTSLYNRLLVRAPDAGGLAGFTTMLAQGGTVEQIEAIMIGSDEYFQKRDAKANDNFVSTLFGDLLGRAPDSGASSYFIGQLNQQTPRSSVVSQILGSNEAAQHTVDRLFQAVLRRGADPGAKTFYGNLLQMGQTSDMSLTAGLAASDEYFANV